MVDEKDEGEGDLPSDVEQSTGTEPAPRERESTNLGDDLRESVARQKKARAPRGQEDPGEPQTPPAAPKQPKATEAAQKAPQVDLGVPPPGFSVKTKADWAKLPQYARDDILKRESEMNSGMARYSGLSSFAEEAERNGTTLQNAVRDYVTVENALRRDFVGGVEFLCQRMGIPVAALIKGFVDKYGGKQPDGNAQQPPPQSAQFGPQDVSAMVRREIEMRDALTETERFRADPANRFFENVRRDMALLVQSGREGSLRDLYDTACWMNPEIRAILQEEARAGGGTAARAQRAAKAVLGSPSSPSTEPPARKHGTPISADIRQALAMQRGR